MKIKYKEVFKEKGFSLAELLIGMGLLAGASLGATKVMEILNKQQRTGEIKSTLKQSMAQSQKLMGNNLNSLSEFEFNTKFYYQLNSGTGMLQSVDSPPNNAEDIKNEWLNMVPSKNYQRVFSSFNYSVKRSNNDPMNKRYIRYFSVCLPISEANDLYESDEDLNTIKMSQLERWPFIKNSSNGRFNIRCCPLDTPNCDGDIYNPLSPNTEYVLRIVRNDIVVKMIEDPDNPGGFKDEREGEEPLQVIKQTPPKGSLRNLTGAGFFNYRLDSNLISHSVYYYNNCISNKVIGGQEEGANCDNRFRLEHKVRTFPINTKLGAGAKDIGNIGW